jgi:hypothetical protein
MLLPAAAAARVLAASKRLRGGQGARRASVCVCVRVRVVKDPSYRISGLDFFFFTMISMYHNGPTGGRIINLIEHWLSQCRGINVDVQ